VTEIPEDLDEVCGGDIPMTKQCVARRFQTLALEVRALKREEVEERLDRLESALEANGRLIGEILDLLRTEETS